MLEKFAFVFIVLSGLVGVLLASEPSENITIITDHNITGPGAIGLGPDLFSPANIFQLLKEEAKVRLIMNCLGLTVSLMVGGVAAGMWYLFYYKKKKACMKEKDAVVKMEEGPLNKG